MAVDLFCFSAWIALLAFAFFLVLKNMASKNLCELILINTTNFKQLVVH